MERLMRNEALRARPRRRGLPADTGERAKAAIAANVLDRQFEARAPNQKWVADFIYIWTAEGWLYVAAVIDLFSRRVVGWSRGAAMTAQLVTDALMMAIWRREKPDALLQHSDQSSQCTSEQFQKLMADNGLSCSMSRSGNVRAEPSRRHRFKPDGEGRDGEFLLFAENRAHRAEGRPHAQSGSSRRVRLYRMLLQPAATPLDHRRRQPYGVRAGRRRELN
jgi:transposase InsO family protein